MRTLRNAVVAVLTHSLIIPLAAAAEPDIEQLRWQGDLREVLEVRGQGFGDEGPTVRLYTTFSGQTFGDPEVGQWFYDETSMQVPKRQDDVRVTNTSSFVGDGSALVVDISADSDYGHKAFQYARPGNSDNGTSIFQEVYFSYAVKDEATFPGPGGTRTSFSNMSSTKDAWLMLGFQGNAGPQFGPWVGNDFVVPGWASGFLIHSNTNQIGAWRFNTAGLEDNWEFGDWNQIFFHAEAAEQAPVEGDTSDPSSSGSFGFANDNAYNVTRDIGPFMTNAEKKPYWDRIKFGPWYNFSDEDKPVCRVHDEIYVATGENANARVMVGDAAKLSQVTRLHHAVPVEWSDERITVDVAHLDLASDGQDWYVYVFDGHGAANRAGRAVFGECGECPEPPPDVTAEKVE